MRHNVRGVGLKQSAMSARLVTSESKGRSHSQCRGREDVSICLNCKRDRCTGECAAVRYARK